MLSSIQCALLLTIALRACACDNERSKTFTPEDDRSKKLNILMISDFPMGHVSFVLPVGEELAQRGHNVTLLLVMSEDADQAKYKALAESYGVHLWNVTFKIPFNASELPERMSKSFFKTLINEVAQYMAFVVSSTIKHANGSISAGDWDIVVGTEFLPGLLPCLQSAHNVKVLTIDRLASAFHLYPPWPWPGLTYGASSDNFGFTDRAKNFPFKYAYAAIISLMVSPSMTVLSDYCPSVGLRQALTDTAVHIPAIVPTAMGFEYPNTISSMTHYVGPLVSRYPALLMGELGEWLESKPDRSVVYISMGSVYNLDKEDGRAFLEGVMNTNYSLLWSLRKSNQRILEGLDVDPDRVLISDWTPQLSVLGSKAIHSAILHGGFTGLSEALWNGVPVLVIPRMSEQLYNAGRVHFNGLGIHLDADTLSSSKITESLRALDTGEYRSKVARLQKIFRMAGGVKRAADLVEFYEDVGYEHLVPAYAKYQWSWVQYYNADVYALMMLILVIVAMCLITCCKCIRRRCCLEKVKDKND